MKISVIVMSLLFVATHSSNGFSQTVGGTGGTSPVDSTVFPQSPTTEDVVVFNLTADGTTYSNQCGQLSAFGGESFEVIVDESTRSIQIGVTGNPPEFCTGEFVPVNGLSGSVGPLSAGVWEIQTSFPGSMPPFSTFGETLSFTVTTASQPITGDFDGDGDVDCDDLDGYIGNLGMAATGELLALDFDGDGTIRLTDANFLITSSVQTSNGRVGTFPGDLNCDGEVDVLFDAFTLVSNLGNSATRYSQGDINFDGTVNVLGDAFLLVRNLGRTNAP